MDNLDDAELIVGQDAIQNEILKTEYEAEAETQADTTVSSVVEENLSKNEEVKNEGFKDKTERDTVYNGSAKLYCKPLRVRFFIFGVIVLVLFCLCFGVFLMLDLVKGANVTEFLVLASAIGVVVAFFYFFVVERAKLLLMDDRIVVYRTCRTCEQFALEDFTHVNTKRIYNGGHYIPKTQYLCFKKYRKGKAVGELKLNLNFLKHDDIVDLINRIYSKCRPHITEEYGVVDEKGYVNQRFEFNAEGINRRAVRLKCKIGFLSLGVSLVFVAVPALLCKFVAGGDLNDIIVMCFIGLFLSFFVFLWARRIFSAVSKVQRRSATSVEIKRNGIEINEEQLVRKDDIKYISISSSLVSGVTAVKIKGVSYNMKLYFDSVEEPDSKEEQRMMKTLEYWCDINRITYSEEE
ncbi:MAG: hypothetical protein MJ153_04130 [Clostridia bacterium]|nr:hypothetical protein [Clostridia bacterium]